MQDRRRREVHTDRFTLLLLLGQLWQQVEHLPYKPVVTLALMGFQIAAHVEPAAIPFLNYSVSSICLDPAAVSQALSMGDYASALLRLWGSAFVHINDYHLYYNMASLLYKGGSLETSFGSGPFGCLCLMMLALAHGLVLLAWGLAGTLGLGSTFGHPCFTGFSAVLFALKYIAYSNQAGQVHVYFFSVAAKYATWLELLLMYAVAPNNSIVCHMCGIAAGAVVVHLPHLAPYQLAWLYLQHYVAMAGGAHGGFTGPFGGAPRAAPRAPTGERGGRYTYHAAATGTRAADPTAARHPEPAQRRWGVNDEID